MIFTLPKIANQLFWFLTQVAKRSQEIIKNQKKKPMRSAKKSNPKDAGKEESSLSHHERRQGKIKHSNNKNKKN